MPMFSDSSITRLNECHVDLQLIFNNIIGFYDCVILEGHRNEERQNEMYRSGKSRVRYPNGKHNEQPSLAVDVAPYPIDWNNRERFYYLAGIVDILSRRLYNEGKISHRVRWGGDWDRDYDYKDNSFDDLVHFELVKV